MPEPMRVAVFLTSRSNDYLRTVEADALAAGKRAGLSVEVAYADNQAISQIQQIYARLREEGEARPRALLVMPVVDESLARVARAAIAAQVGWVSLFRRSPYVEELRRANPGLPIFVASPDQGAVGRIQGRQIRALLPEGGHVLFVKGMPSSSSTQERFEATQQELRGSAVEVVGEVDGNWAEDLAEDEVERWLRLLSFAKEKRVDLVAAHSDVMARGARAALRKAAAGMGRPELAQVPVIGADGLPDVGRRMVDDGQLAATIVLPSPSGPAIEAIGKALTRGDPTPTELLMPPAGYPEEHRLSPHSKPSS